MSCFLNEQYSHQISALLAPVLVLHYFLSTYCSMPIFNAYIVGKIKEILSPLIKQFQLENANSFDALQTSGLGMKTSTLAPGRLATNEHYNVTYSLFSNSTFVVMFQISSTAT